MNKVIYTVITGGYDTPIEQPKQEGWYMVLLTDDKNIEAPGWKVIAFDPWSDPEKHSRRLKIMAHEYIDYDVYMYVDANYEITGQVDIDFKGGYLTVKHWKRRCIYEEARAVLRSGKDKPSIVKKQMTAYAKAKHPKNGGLFANGFFIRDRSADELCYRWWDEVNQHSHRDQLSLPYVNDGTVETINAVPKWLKLHNHRRYEKGNPDVYYFSPNRGDKKLGEWYNKHCELVPNDDDWICITDHDVMFLTPHSAKLIEDVIKLHGATYQLFSCLTNRLGLKYQTPYGMDHGRDVLAQVKIAEQHYSKHYTKVERCMKPTAGLFMLFQKKTWKDNKFMPGIVGRDGKFIDWQFSNGILKSGGKIGLMKGMYVYHLYRLGKSTRQIDHLR